MRTLILIGALAVSACVEDPSIDGRQAFQESCASCHGADARGNGEMAHLVSIAPPDLTTLAARNGGVFPRDYVMSTIDGYHRSQAFAPDMPEFGSSDMGGTVMIGSTPVPARLYALALYVESIQATDQ